jgi:hypothetical protein
MGALDRLTSRSPDEADGEDEAVFTEDRTEEDALRVRLVEDPNDIPAFDRLAKIVRSRAAEGHDAGDPQREADDAVWALAEEIAHSSRAWYPLIQLARLSIDDDREVALRRLATAADRDSTGEALGQGLGMLRDSGHSVEALNLGVGHWRPREHVVEAGRQLIAAAIESDRPGEARRHLDAMAAHPDQEGVERMRRELEGRIAKADQAAASRRANTGSFPAVGLDPSPEPADPAAPPTGAGGGTGGGAGTGGGGSGGVDIRDQGSRLMGFLQR